MDAGKKSGGRAVSRRSFILGMIVNIVVSLMTPEPDEGIQLLYDEVHKK